MKNGRISAAALVAATVLAVPAGAQAAGYDDAVRADDPLTYLRMQEATGGIVQDSSTYDRDGTLVGAATLDPMGPFVAAGRSLALGNGSLTAHVPARSGAVELWVNPTRLRRGEQAGFVAHGDPAADGWALGVGAKRKLTFVTRGSRTASKVSLPADAWSMLSVTWDAGKVRFAVNGAAGKPVPLSVPAPASGDSGMVLGGTARGAFSGTYAGRMDEVALFGRTLTDTDIREHFAAAQVPVNTVPVVVDGDPVVGGDVGTQPGQWTGATDAPVYQWQRCDADGDDCDDIPGATSATYEVTQADACFTLRVIETRSSASGSTTTVSQASAIVPCSPSAGTGGAGGGSGPVPTPVAGGGSDVAATTIGAQVAGSQPLAVGTIAARAPGACLKLVSTRRAVKVARLGTLRIRTAANGCITAAAPMRLGFVKAKGKRVASVTYRLGGRLVRTAKRGSSAAAVQPARLRAGVQVLTVRVAPRGGKARTAILKLKLATT